MEMHQNSRVLTLGVDCRSKASECSCISLFKLLNRHTVQPTGIATVGHQQHWTIRNNRIPQILIGHSTR